MKCSHWRFLAVAGLAAIVNPALSLGSDFYRGTSDPFVQAAVDIVNDDVSLTTSNQEGEAAAITADASARPATDTAVSPSDSKEAAPSAPQAVPATSCGACYQGTYFSSSPAYVGPRCTSASWKSPSCDSSDCDSAWGPSCLGSWWPRFGSLFHRNDCDCDSGCGLFSGFRGCGLGCDHGCDSWGGCGLLGGLRSYIQPGEKCFSDFISPVSNPIYFEDPRTLSEVRFLFMNHELPSATGAHSLQVYAAQIRVALSNRLSMIVTKDGFMYTQAQNLGLDPGAANLNAGFKYNIYRDPHAGRILSSGFTYEIPWGSRDVLQGYGDGELNFFLTGGTRILGSPRAHWLSTGGLRQPLDQSVGSRITYWSNHFDYRLPTQLPTYAFTEFNWWHYENGGSGNAEGSDLFNVGTLRPGTSLVTQAVGLRFKLRPNVETGGAFEFPLGPNDGMFRDRLTLDFIVRY